MKTLFVLGLPNPFAGAGWNRIGFFAKDWSRRGYLVEVLGAFSYKTFQKRGPRKFSKVNIFNLTFHMDLGHPFVFVLNSAVSFMVSTLFLIARKPNVVIVSVPSGDVGLGALIACILLRVKCMVDYRDEWEDYAISLTNHKTVKLFYSIIKKLTACLYAKSQLVVAVTPNLIEVLKQRGVANVKFIPNGADVRMFKPLSSRKNSKSFTVVYSGSVGGYYRLDVVLKSMKILIDRKLNDIKLFIAGVGEIERVLNLALKLGLSNNVEYRGVINSKSELVRLIAEADIGLIPYDDNPLWKNAYGTKVFEYCACGIPVMATVYEDSVLANLIKEHKIGLVTPPLNVEALAVALEYFFSDEKFRVEAGKNGRTLVVDRFNREKLAEELLKTLVNSIENK